MLKYLTNTLIFRYVAKFNDNLKEVNMNSIEFPKMFNTSNTNIVKDEDASMQNLRVLLGCEKGELFGDPFYGIRLKRYIFDQNNFVLRDILIDEIYTQIMVFVPQFTVRRNDIKIIQDGKDVRIRFKALNNLDYTTNMYDLVLFREEER